ncbi:hypothetical protein [Pseudomonas duriflava]|nr:hypothetical protein [Pseudomonas duriflava]
MSVPDTLFADFDVQERLAQQRAQLPEEIAALAENQILQSPPARLVDYFVQKNTIQPPVLRRSDWQMDVQEDYAVEEEAPIQRLEIEVPFDGDEELFQARSGAPFETSLPIKIHKQSLLITLEVKPGEEHGAKAMIERTLNDIDKHLDRIRSVVMAYNEALVSQVEAEIEKRRQQLLGRKALLAALDIPLRPRPGGARPGSRKPLPALPLVPAEPQRPEPTLTPTQYEQVLEAVHGAVECLSYSPSLFAAMDEGLLRNHVLLHINAAFERDDGAEEAFRAKGPAGFELLVGGRGVFTGECLFWSHAEAYNRYLDELLASALWQEAKAVLLVFQRGKRTASVLKNVCAATESHPGYVASAINQVESGCRFVLQVSKDTSRQITLTVRIVEAPNSAVKTKPTSAPRRTRKADPAAHGQAGFDF